MTLKKKAFLLDLNQTAIIQVLINQAIEEGSVFPDKQLVEIMTLLSFDSGLELDHLKMIEQSTNLNKIIHFRKRGIHKTPYGKSKFRLGSSTDV